MTTSRPSIHLLPFVIVLLGGFFLRIHLPDRFPAYIDEYRHIVRAQAIYTFQQNPIEYMHGKLLLYGWVGLFQPEGLGALVVSRLAIVLALLVSSATVVVIARLLFENHAAIPALVFYSAAPYSLFFERMVLADSVAAALGALAVWNCIRMVRQPTRGNAALLGLTLGLAPLAKLTAAPLIAMPLLAILLLDHRTVTRASLSSLWPRYNRPLRIAGTVFGLLWAMFGLLVLLSLLNGGRPLIADRQLLAMDNTVAARSLGDKMDVVWEAMALLFSRPFRGLAIALTLLALWKRPYQMFFALSWLGLLLMPNVILTNQFEGRYLLVAMPALAVVIGGGIGAAGEVMGRFVPRTSWQSIGATAAALGLSGIWLVTFAVPRDIDTVTDPAAAELPTHERYLYFTNPSTGWGIPELITLLEAQGERVDGVIPVVGVLASTDATSDYCGLVTLYLPEDVTWSCLVQSDFPNHIIPSDVNQWPHLAAALQRGSVVYVVSNVVPDNAPPDQAGAQWTLLAAPDRPHGGPKMALWEVRPVR
jgi:4-amino-4-deoxy-L-arabinose transferase-like glycosyltransferase